MEKTGGCGRRRLRRASSSSTSRLTTPPSSKEKKEEEDLTTCSCHGVLPVKRTFIVMIIMYEDVASVVECLHSYLDTIIKKKCT